MSDLSLLHDIARLGKTKSEILKGKAKNFLVNLAFVFLSLGFLVWFVLKFSFFRLYSF